MRLMTSISAGELVLGPLLLPDLLLEGEILLGLELLLLGHLHPEHEEAAEHGVGLADIVEGAAVLVEDIAGHLAQPQGGDEDQGGGDQGELDVHMVVAALRHLPGEEEVKERVGHPAADQVGQGEGGRSPAGTEDQHIERAGEVLHRVGAHHAVGGIRQGDGAGEKQKSQPHRQQLHHILDHGVGKDQGEGQAGRRPQHRPGPEVPPLLQRDHHQGREQQDIGGKYAPVLGQQEKVPHRAPPP